MQQLTVTRQQDGMRIDKLLGETYDNFSRSSWQKLIHRGLVCVNGEKVEVGKYCVREGQTIVIDDIADFPQGKSPDVPIIYEDNDVNVWNKPSGMLTHETGQLVEEWTIASLMRKRGYDDGTNRSGIVHRLDRETSGVILTAKSENTKRYLQKQFAKRTVQKLYVALVHGQVHDTEMSIEVPIMRDPSKPSLYIAHPHGKTALTTITNNKRYKNGFSLLELRPKTGRTHQLRVHLNYIGHPICGDKRYGRSDAFPRLMLHAYSLTVAVRHNEMCTFSAPVPPEFHRL